MNSKVERRTVDLSAFPDLVVIYLGMRVNAWTGLKTPVGLVPQSKFRRSEPDGSCCTRFLLMSFVPLHLDASILARLRRLKPRPGPHRIAMVARLSSVVARNGVLA